VKDVQTLHGADIDSDHNLLVARICTSLKKIIRFQIEDHSEVWRNYMLSDKECRIL